MTLSLPPVSAARIHSHLLGGQDAFPLDHAVACHATKAAPWWPSAVQGMHHYGERMVAHLAARGLDQVLDLGSGLPSPRGRQIHQIAAAFNQGPRGARTVYVDHDPHTHIRRCIDLTDQHGATSILADITDTGALFEHPELQVLNLRRPVAVLLHDVLPWLPDEEAAHLLTELRRRLAPGSFISVTHLIPSPPPYATTPLVRCYLEAGIRLWPRSLATISSWSGTCPAYTHGPHTGAGPVPVCALLLGAPGPVPFTRPPFWSSPQHARPRRTP
ncbi:SAM-dependent methyltransferase [Streptomyces sp. ASQP_92]|uniref:SAM-dependent methyltransferase n=1 Tax=Streptomyces sp. ASQP_92 TaxID=2979116 RepID=UPI0021BE4ACE|nr:SAM-dependent methyltransferase [Streptomyces sp. ASQP_92]MCT9093484.1 SAM-dependent methyltransferase [Streptomyces sp. ASQP_92]